MAKFIVKPTGTFRKDLKLAKKRGLPLSDLYTVMDLLATGEPLPEKNHDHPLHGDYEGYRECHINPDGCSSTRRTLKYASFPSTAQARTPTCSGRGRKDNEEQANHNYERIDRRT